MISSPRVVVLARGRCTCWKRETVCCLMGFPVPGEASLPAVSLVVYLCKHKKAGAIVVCSRLSFRFLFVTRLCASANTRPDRPTNNHLNGSRHRGGHGRMGAGGVAQSRIHVRDYTGLLFLSQHTAEFRGIQGSANGDCHQLVPALVRDARVRDVDGLLDAFRT